VVQIVSRQAAQRALAALRQHRVLVALTVLAALLRFSTLDVQSFWQDEASTALLMRLDVLDMLRVIPAKESTPPPYFLLAWFWSRVFGAGEVGLRSLSALFGTATVPIAYAAAASVSRRAGLVAGALTATSPILVWYSQEARSYALVVFLAALSFLFFLRALKWPGQRVLVGWALSSALALVAHYFAIFVVAPEAAWLLARSPQRRRATVAVGAVAAAGLAILPLALAVRAAKWPGANPTEWIVATPLSERFLDVWRSFLGATHPQFPSLLVALTAALAGVGLLLLALRADGGERRGGLVALAIGVVAIGGALALAGLGLDYVLDRYLLPALVPLTIALAAGFGARRAGRVGPLCAGALCGLFTLSVALTVTHKDLQRDDWRGVAAALGKAHETRVILVPRGGSRPLRLYLPAVRRAPQTERLTPAILTKEVIVIVKKKQKKKEKKNGALPRRFIRTQQRTVSSFEIATFRSRRAVRLALRAPSTTHHGSPRAAVLIQLPSGGQIERDDR
jgi:mannosyltransferase